MEVALLIIGCLSIIFSLVLIITTEEDYFTTGQKCTIGLFLILGAFILYISGLGFGRKETEKDFLHGKYELRIETICINNDSTTLKVDSSYVLKEEFKNK